MKESKLLEMQNKIETLGNVVNILSREVTYVKDLSVGTMRLVKKFKGYKKALQELKDEHAKKQIENEPIQGKDTV
tara:strand:+ start:281 stop:505 length:225 start_codon:yes stop_codon:yes gene_type:complete